MTLFRLVLAAAGLFPCVSPMAAQTWKTITSFHRIQDAVLVEDRLFYATTGGVVAFTPADGRFGYYRTSDGLYNNDILALAYDPIREKIIAGGFDGSLSILDLSSMIWHTQTAMLGAQINDFKVMENLLLISTSRGFCTLDLGTETVKDCAFKLGTLAANTPILASAYDAQYLWSITAGAVARASRFSVNLQTPSEWRVYGNGQGLVAQDLTDLIVYRDTLYLSTSDRGVMRYDALLDTFVDHNSGLGTTAASFTVGGASLVAYTGSAIFLPNDTGWVNAGIPFIDDQAGSFSAVQIRVTAEGQYLATGAQGGVYRRDGTVWTVYRVNAPFENNFAGLYFDRNTKLLWCASYAGWSVSGPGFYALDTRTGSWSNYNKFLNPAVPWGGYYNVSVDQNGDVWMGSWGAGVTRFNTTSQSFQVYNSTNGLSTNKNYCTQDIVLVNDAFMDSRGLIWLLTHNPCDLEQAIAVLDPLNGQFAYFSVADLDGSFSPAEMVEDRFGRYWFATRPPIPQESNGRGVRVAVVGPSVFEKSDDSWSGLNTTDGLISNNVTALAEDQDGIMWIGLEEGLQSYNLFTDELSLEYFYPNGPISEYITDILVDKFNNKWFSTPAGVSLLTYGGEWVHYNKENSGLADNNVRAIAFNDSTGEIYFGTFDKGLSVLKHPLVQTNAASSTFPYPNPFVIGRDETVTFSSVPSQSIVKIFTIAGEPVRTIHVTSISQTVTWDGRDTQGRYVASGIYLFHVYPSAGAVSTFPRKSGKIAVIRD